MAPLPSSPTPMSPGSVLGTVEIGLILVLEAGWGTWWAWANLVLCGNLAFSPIGRLCQRPENLRLLAGIFLLGRACHVPGR